MLILLFVLILSEQFCCSGKDTDTDDFLLTLKLIWRKDHVKRTALILWTIKQS